MKLQGSCRTVASTTRRGGLFEPFRRSLRTYAQDADHHGIGPLAPENVPVGPSAPSSAACTASRAPSSTVSVPCSGNPAFDALPRISNSDWTPHLRREVIIGAPSRGARFLQTVRKFDVQRHPPYCSGVRTQALTQRGENAVSLVVVASLQSRSARLSTSTCSAVARPRRMMFGSSVRTVSANNQ